MTSKVCCCASKDCAPGRVLLLALPLLCHYP